MIYIGDFKVKQGVFILFLVIGLLLSLGAGYSVYDVKQFKKSAILTQGTVIQLIENIDNKNNSKTFTPVIHYKTVKGDEFTMTSSVSSNPPAYSIGETVSIFYKGNNPQEARIDGFLSNWLLTLILGTIGLVFFLIGSIPLILSSRAKSNAAYLKQHGIKLKALYSSVEHNTSLTVNGRSPFRIVCQWQNPSDNKLFIFRSENVWFNPEPYIDRQHIDVYVKPANYKKYVVDVSFLPELA